jgi:hypothetical protein
MVRQGWVTLEVVAQAADQETLVMRGHLLPLLLQPKETVAALVQHPEQLVAQEEAALVLSVLLELHLRVALVVRELQIALQEHL